MSDIFSLNEPELAWIDGDVTSSKGARDENFPVATKLFRREKRNSVAAYYQFARTIDDMADNCRLSARAKIARLAAMAQIVEGRYTAPTRMDAQTALNVRSILSHDGIDLCVATDLIVAFIQDAEKNRYETWEELLNYCRFSANPVGRFLLLLHGQNEACFAASDALCSALQILNHLQDMTSDLKLLDRSYLPQMWMREAGANTGDVLLVRSKPQLMQVIHRLLDEVDGLIACARCLPRQVTDPRMRLYTAIVFNLCVRLARRLRANDPVLKRVALTRWDMAVSVISSIPEWIKVFAHR